jgi:predicted aconitase
MTLKLNPSEERLLAGQADEGTALAMRILVEASQVLGARNLIPIHSAHIDGCLYHGDSGALFAERLTSHGARVHVPTTLNVGALDLLHGDRTRLAPEAKVMARRLMDAYVAMGARPTWTCAPYQAGHRPGLGQDVAWGESNAVVFCNSVLGARTNRYGDFLDICAAITGRAPYIGLHCPENRIATLMIDASSVPAEVWREDIAYPVFGAWLGRTVGTDIAAIEGVGRPSEDQLKALGAAAASSGAVGLFHIIGVTPEARDRATAFANAAPKAVIPFGRTDFEKAKSGLSTVYLQTGDPIDAVAIGSPHLSGHEIRELFRLLNGRPCKKPLYACTGRHVLESLRDEGLNDALGHLGVILIADTCVVVTPVLPSNHGVLVTNSGKFALYTPTNTGYDVVFESLSGCVESAVAGTLQSGKVHAA